MSDPSPIEWLDQHGPTYPARRLCVDGYCWAVSAEGSTYCRDHRPTWEETR